MKSKKGNYFNPIPNMRNWLAVRGSHHWVLEPFIHILKMKLQLNLFRFQDIGQEFMEWMWAGIKPVRYGVQLILALIKSIFIQNIMKVVQHLQSMQLRLGHEVLGLLESG